MIYLFARTLRTFLRSLSSSPHPAAALAILLVGGALLSPPLVAASPRLNVVFILADDLRPDAIHALGNPVVQTPHLDKLAAHGCIFTRATCGYPICHVSRSQIVTGRILLGADMPGHPLRLDPHWTLWPQVLQEAGWFTIFSGKWHIQGTPVMSGYGVTAGLYSSGGAKNAPLTFPLSATGRKVTGYTGWTFKDENGNALTNLGVGLTPDTDTLMTDKVIAALHTRPDKPFFLHVNLTEPHDPLHWPRGMEQKIDPAIVPLPGNFRPQHPFDHGNIAGRDEVIVPAPRTGEDVKRELAVYLTLADNIDVQVGRIVKALEDAGEYERTLIIFSSDHGLAVGSHGLMGKQNQYEHTINVPLIISGPGFTGGRKIEAQCYLRDLYPTICDLAGLPIPATVEGRSLMPVVRGEKAEIYDAIFGSFTDTQRMIRTADGWKLIWYPKIKRRQLFHVSTDALELHDLIDDPAEANRIATLQTQLTTWLREHGDPLKP